MLVATSFPVFQNLYVSDCECYFMPFQQIKRRFRGFEFRIKDNKRTMVRYAEYEIDNDSKDMFVNIGRIQAIDMCFSAIENLKYRVPIEKISEKIANIEKERIEKENKK